MTRIYKHAPKYSEPYYEPNPSMYDMELMWDQMRAKLTSTIKWVMKQKNMRGLDKQELVHDLGDVIALCEALRDQQIELHVHEREYQEVNGQVNKALAREKGSK